MSPIALNIAAKLAHVPAFAGHCLDNLRIGPLPGLTNHNYKLIIEDTAYVLRLPGAGSEHYIDRAQEKHNAGIASALGLNPQIVYFDAHSGVQITRFIAGSTLDSAAFGKPLFLQQAATALRRLHNSGRRFKGRMRLFPKLDEYIGLAQICRDPLMAELKRLRAQFEPIRASFEQNTLRLCPCHIDPAPANFIATDTTLYLLDWEYSAVCEPLWDLAALSLEADFGSAQDQAMLHYYFSLELSVFRLDETPLMTRFVLYKRLLTLLAAAWGLVQMANGNNKSDFRVFVRDRLNRVMQNVQSPES